ncbi:MAG: mevalonate kinase [Deltaproteobacteria bacterium]|jgi:mevalonate kinase|nr:mevalonate kinase [Deltaproteobacteria bacterium]
MQNNHQSLTSAGKIIILGEHSVVYGAPALALPLAGAVNANFKKRDDHQFKLFSSAGEIRDPLIVRALSRLRSLSDTAGFDLTITRNQLPTGSGLGSSAALSFLLAKTALRLERITPPQLQQIHDLTHELEKVFHSNPSGIDDTVVCHRKPVIFQKGGYANSTQLKGSSFTNEIFFPSLHLPDDLQFSICCSKTKTSTSKMVKLVKHTLESENSQKEFKNNMEIIFNKAMLNWKSDDFISFGQKLSLVHSYYIQLGISTPQLDDIVEIALNQGALGAKLSGSGGGGCAIILHKKRELLPIKNELQNIGYLFLKLEPSYSL